MIKDGVHLGHLVNQWNPEMKHFLAKKTKRLTVSKTKAVTIHLLDLVKTTAHLNYVASRLTKTAKEKKIILFVGTGKTHAPLTARLAKACDAYYVTEKWLGGMLTNWNTINLSTERLRKYDVVLAQKLIETMPKKEAARAYKDQKNLSRILGGIKFMMQKPDLVVVIGQLKEINALKECEKLNIKTISISDTNCDPRKSDFIIPANDDSVASLQRIFKTFVAAVKRGQILATGRRFKRPLYFKKHYDKVTGPPRRRKKKTSNKTKPKLKTHRKDNFKKTVTKSKVK